MARLDLGIQFFAGGIDRDVHWYLDGVYIEETYVSENFFQNYDVTIEDTKIIIYSDTVDETITYDYGVKIESGSVKYFSSGAEPGAEQGWGYYVYAISSQTTTPTVSGAWRFNEVLDTSDLEFYTVVYLRSGDSYATDAIYSVKFDSNNEAFVGINILQGSLQVPDTLSVYSKGQWEDEAYRVVDFGEEQEVDEDFYSWLLNYATPLETTTPTITVNGTAVSSVIVNGKECSKVVCDGVTVFENGGGN